MKYEVAIAEDIPDSMIELTCHPIGAMSLWLRVYKANMVAVIAYDESVAVGWCAFRIVTEDTVEVGTYIKKEYRGKKLATTLLDETMMLLSSEILPNAFVRYGGALYSEYHTTLDRIIRKHNLNPVHYFNVY